MHEEAVRLEATMDQPREQGRICVSLVLELGDGHRLELDFSDVQRFYFYQTACPGNRIAMFDSAGTGVGRTVFVSWLEKVRRKPT